MTNGMDETGMHALTEPKRAFTFSGAGKTILVSETHMPFA
jgi:hypothetical protein